MATFCAQCPSLKESFICDLSEKVRDEIRSKGVIIHYKKGQDIIRQGMQTEGVFCIRKGYVKLLLENMYGEPLTIKLYANAGMVGIHALTSDSNVYTATCLSDCDVCFFPKDVIGEAAAKYSNLAKRLNQISLDNFVQLSNVAVSLVSKSVPQRVAEALISIQQIFGKDHQGNIQQPITKEEIARMVGTSIESVFRTLSDFRKKKYIYFENRQIKILDEPRLRSLGRVA